MNAQNVKAETSKRWNRLAQHIRAFEHIRARQCAETAALLEESDPLTADLLAEAVRHEKAARDSWKTAEDIRARGAAAVERARAGGPLKWYQLDCLEQIADAVELLDYRQAVKVLDHLEAIQANT